MMNENITFIKKFTCYHFNMSVINGKKHFLAHEELMLYFYAFYHTSNYRICKKRSYFIVIILANKPTVTFSHQKDHVMQW